MREHKSLSWGLGLLFALMWLGGLGACGGTKAPATTTSLPTDASAGLMAEAEWHALAYRACTHWVAPLVSGWRPVAYDNQMQGRNLPLTAEMSFREPVLAPVGTHLWVGQRA